MMKHSTLLLGAAALVFVLSQAASPALARGHGGGGHHGGGHFSGGHHGGGHFGGGGHHGGGHYGGGHHGGGHYGGGYHGGGHYHNHWGGAAAGALIGFGVGAAVGNSSVCPPPGQINNYSLYYPGACDYYDDY